jgi:hypothetical protein
MMDVIPEVAALSVIAFLSLILTYWRAWSGMRRRRTSYTQASFMTLGMWIWVALVTAAALCLAIAFALSPPFRLAWDRALLLAFYAIVRWAVYPWVVIPVGLVLLLAFAIGWWVLFSRARSRTCMLGAFGTSLMVAVAVIVAPVNIMAMWMLGLIPFYEVALWLALLVVFFSLRVGFRATDYFSYLSVRPGLQAGQG